MPLISIIIPVYNVEKYLSRCLDSVINQTYTNLEIILVDDCSTDNSLAICNQYKRIDKRIIVLHHDVNKGQSAARNTGLKIMHGEYITFVDSDDFIYKDYVSHMYDLMNEYKCDIVQTGFFFGEKNNFPKEDRKEKLIFKDKYTWAKGFKYKTILVTKLYSRSVVANIYLPEGKKLEDDGTYYLFAYNSNRICISNKRLYYYYSANPNSIYRAEKELQMDFIELYDKRLKFFEEKNEPYLLKKSYERYAIVILLICSNYRHLHITDEQNEIMIEKFNEIYPQAVKGASVIYKPLLIAFKMAPKFCGKIIRLIRR